jgi:hypothetical protein
MPRHLVSQRLNGFKNGVFITETTPSMVLKLQATDSLQQALLSHGLETNQIPKKARSQIYRLNQQLWMLGTGVNCAPRKCLRISQAPNAVSLALCVPMR